MPSAKKLFFKMCPRSMVKTAVNVVNRGRLIRGQLETALSPQKEKHFCPCCGSKSKTFVAGSYADYPERFNPVRYENTKQDVLCPVCRSLPRHRILASWCDNHKELVQKADDILYFAPEYSMTLWLRRNRISYKTADLYKEADLKLDIQATGLPDESYDMIICNHVLEHVDDFRAALEEMYRILRPRGSFICSFPMDPKVEFIDEDPNVQTPEERFHRFGQDDHKRVFGMKANQLLTATGFSVEIINGADYPEKIMPVVGPADYDMNILFRCVKPTK